MCLRWRRIETAYAHTVTAAAKMTLARVWIRHDVDCITVENTQLVIRHVVSAGHIRVQPRRYAVGKPIT